MTSRTSGASNIADVALDLKRETDKAFLVSDGDQDVWMPKAVVEHDGRGIFSMPEWLAIARGLV